MGTLHSKYHGAAPAYNGTGIAIWQAAEPFRGEGKNTDAGKQQRRAGCSGEAPPPKKLMEVLL